MTLPLSPLRAGMMEAILLPFESELALWLALVDRMRWKGQCVSFKAGPQEAFSLPLWEPFQLLWTDLGSAAAWWKTHVHHPLPLPPVLWSEPIWCAANPSPYQKNHPAEPSLNSLTAESCSKFGLLCGITMAIKQYIGYPPYTRNLESRASQNERYRDEEDSSYP